MAQQSSMIGAATGEDERRLNRIGAGWPCASSEVTSIVPVPRAPTPPVRPVDKLAPLRNPPLFREFPPAVIEELGTYMTRRSVRRGATIFAKGDPGPAPTRRVGGAGEIKGGTTGG